MIWLLQNCTNSNLEPVLDLRKVRGSQNWLHEMYVDILITSFYLNRLSWNFASRITVGCSSNGLNLFMEYGAESVQIFMWLKNHLSAILKNAWYLGNIALVHKLRLDINLTQDKSWVWEEARTSWNSSLCVHQIYWSNVFVWEQTFFKSVFSSL